MDEAKKCDARFPVKYGNEDMDIVFRTFNRMMLLGKVRQATRYLTQRCEAGGVLHPNEMAFDKKGPLNKTVLEVFREKHPDPGVNHESAFLDCNEENLPVLVDLDVTASHTEKIARKISGSGGPSRTDADQWCSFLLRYGNASLRLREAVAASTRKHANSIVEWDSIRALVSKRGLALDKMPGVRPLCVG